MEAAVDGRQTPKPRDIPDLKVNITPYQPNACLQNVQGEIPE
jgi:hypothetical protein